MGVVRARRDRYGSGEAFAAIIGMRGPALKGATTRTMPANACVHAIVHPAYGAVTKDMGIQALIDWTVIAVFLGLAAALAVLHPRVPRPSPIPAAIAFCLVRAFEVFWTVSFMPNATMVHAMRALSLATLAWLFVGVLRVARQQRGDHQRAAAAARAATRARKEASSAQSEYDRARTDYQRLMRHRIANPLAAIIGGLQTMLDLDVPAEQRERLLRSMLEQSRRLERTMLDPTRLGVEERELRPVPRLDGWEIEADAAKINEQLILDGAVDGFMCECDDPSCAATLAIELDEYLDAHVGDRDFIVTPTHVDPSIEHVLAKTDHYWVVRKHAEPVDKVQQ